MNNYRLKWIEKKFPIIYYRAWTTAKTLNPLMKKSEFDELDLAHVFLWDETKQGADFWKNRHDFFIWYYDIPF